MIDTRLHKRALSFFAHPDDETLAAGATLSKVKRMGMDVHVAIPATGIHARRNKIGSEAIRDQSLIDLKENCFHAMDALGIQKDRIHFGNFKDNELDSHSRLELIHWLEEIIDTVKPDIVLTHHRYCTNIDHQYCHEAAVVATRPSVKRQIPLLCGEVPSSTGYLRPVQWEPNYFVEVSSEDLDRKILAMASYEGEATLDPHPRSPEVLRALAKVRGSESGFLFAEAFMIQRSFG